LHKLQRTILTLEKRTATLRTLLAQRASDYKLLKAAVRVRDARIRVLHATIGNMPSVIRTSEQNLRVAKLETQIEALRATTPTVILAEFRLTLSDDSDSS